MAKKPQAAATPRHSNFGKNRIAKVARHLKKHPNDTQAVAAVASFTTSDLPTRQKSQEKLGWLKKDLNLGNIIRAQFIGSVTKDQAVKWSRYLSLSKKVLFWPVATLVLNDNKPSIVFKHKNKLSNFKGHKTTKTLEAS